ncbi:hypothetical protein PANDA_003146 [Ailuropoda melanoleuca]|uniref:Uncharacterized protein n=1 Tax=Ailuropoda melanoleuca TaxID=9646 RepID=D2H0Z9_AILME|nr:hypothetical protein PANDA_003146 [Ailuropoda melanoleuca]
MCHVIYIPLFATPVDTVDLGYARFTYQRIYSSDIWTEEARNGGGSQKTQDRYAPIGIKNPILSFVELNCVLGIERETFHVEESPRALAKFGA